MRKMLMAGAVAGIVALGGCGTITVDDVVGKIKAGCGIIVVVEQLASALAGIDLSKIDIAQFVKGICDQFTALEQANAPTVPPPVSAKAQGASDASHCYEVIVNGKKVTACK